MDSVKQNFLEAESVLKKFIEKEENFRLIEKAGQILCKSLQQGGKVISCGNGGSMCDAMHFAEELSGRFRENRPAIAALSISDSSHISCVGNDYGYNMVFSRYIEAIGKSGDVLLAISTSGNSENVINAVHEAKKKKMKVIGLSGKNGGELATLCDVEIRAPWSDYADRAQEIHIKVIHSLIHYIEENL
jgi:D-sedoheptulose 7-phosphate isomerase